eukprot:5502536-Prymnesium_polylepis.1
MGALIGILGHAGHARERVEGDAVPAPAGPPRRPARRPAAAVALQAVGEGPEVEEEGAALAGSGATGAWSSRRRR